MTTRKPLNSVNCSLISYKLCLDSFIVKLKEIGVDYLQGWGIGKPKPLNDVTEDLSNIAR